jgi:hypothetical protein
MILNELLEIQNDWWKTGKVRETIVSKFKLEVFEEMKSNVNDRTGLRRVGSCLTKNLQW